MAVPEQMRGWDGRKLRQVSQHKVASKGTHKDAGCHGDTEKEGHAALTELGLSG